LTFLPFRRGWQVLWLDSGEAPASRWRTHLSRCVDGYFVECEPRPEIYT